ncbi:hypothetical protein FA15DRAFT_600371 [Coprinopsis marcescibilis]|uniref:Uncharacterized protein n=1 Tax=Coprinopsis marcescibilis TaxID=230819 RepID=A0A5C3KII5_COPMA|nr:hypothetical protein FA15DRAFT_600371 [Coprinopsis marcescibilis]
MKNNTTTLASLPEELLERVLDECIANLIAAKHSPSPHATSPYPSPSASPSVSPANSKRGTPCGSPANSTYATPNDTPLASPTRSRPSSPGFPVPSRSTEPISSYHLMPSSSSRSRSSSLNSASSIHCLSTPLLVSRLFHRIGLPLLYRSLTLTSRSQTQKLLEGSLRSYPERARWIRHLVVTGVWQGVGDVLRIIAAANSFTGAPVSNQSKGKGRLDLVMDERWTFVALQSLEITIDVAPFVPNQQQQPHQGQLPPIRASVQPGRTNGQMTGPTQDADAEEFCQGLLALAENGSSALKHMVLKKPQNVYLTHQRAKMVIGALSKVVESADALETAHIAFRLSDDTAAAGSRRAPTSSAPSSPTNPMEQAGPIASFTQALSTRPCLHTLTTHLPSVWNEAILRMSRNDALQRIVLLGGGGKAVTVGGDWGAGSRPNGPNSGMVRSTSTGAIAVATQARALPSNPVERVYAASTRGCDGYAIGVSPTGSFPQAATPQFPPRHGGAGTGMFINEARKHERLCGLIHAGSMGDAETSGVAVPPPSYPGRSNIVSMPVRKHDVPVIAVPTPKPAAMRAHLPTVSVSTTNAVISTPATSPQDTQRSLYVSCSSWISSKLS